MKFVRFASPMIGLVAILACSSSTTMTVKDGGGTGDGAAPGCSGGTVKCGASCTNTTFDPKNCGACGKACALGQACVAGMCACAGGTKDCSGKCVDLTSSAANCGQCGNKCMTAPDLFCVNSACMDCPVGGTIMKCGDDCVDTSKSLFNCGKCDNFCTYGKCVSGKCDCSDDPSLTLCGEACVNTKTDDKHCGGCNKACMSNEFCIDGVCNTL